MTRFKDFGSGAEVDLQPLSFKLHGEEFHCVPQIQGAVLLNLVADSGAEDSTKSAAVISTFFSSVLTDESYARFDALSKDKERIVTVETLAEIVGWLVSEYTDRPTSGPVVS